MSKKWQEIEIETVEVGDVVRVVHNLGPNTTNVSVGPVTKLEASGGEPGFYVENLEWFYKSEFEGDSMKLYGKPKPFEFPQKLGSVIKAVMNSGTKDERTFVRTSANSARSCWYGVGIGAFYDEVELKFLFSNFKVVRADD